MSHHFHTWMQDVRDTIVSCLDDEDCIDYMEGGHEPHYQVPAIPYKVIWPCAWDDIDWHNCRSFFVVECTKWDGHSFSGFSVAEYGPFLD